ncbi:MAG TPA: urea carboxylase-associated family protein [Candidatus Binatia bacterium]|nr:urea carboxylase-associated family protein [Candidatus Binatia bacterium]
MASYGMLQAEIVLQPVSGKALPVLRGQVLRIIQEEGEQCVDFNAFNLHDYKEYMGVSNTRSRYKFRVKKGDMIWTVSSRDRPMYLILEMPETCVTDLLGGRCKASNFAARGLGVHTNCQDTLAAAIGEYDLTPDDVHDSFNMWMNTEWDSTGSNWIAKNTGRKNDYVDLLAIIDTLAVPIVCGSGDTGITSNFSFKPIRVQVYGSSNETLQLVERVERRHTGITGQRTPADFKVNKIKSDRELRRNPNYVSEFVNYPIKVRNIPVELGEADLAKAEEMVANGLAKDIGECLRVALMMWYSRNRTAKASGRLRY